MPYVSKDDEAQGDLNPRGCLERIDLTLAITFGLRILTSSDHRSPARLRHRPILEVHAIEHRQATRTDGSTSERTGQGTPIGALTPEVIATHGSSDHTTILDHRAYDVARDEARERLRARDRGRWPGDKADRGVKAQGDGLLERANGHELEPDPQKTQDEGLIRLSCAWSYQVDERLAGPY